MENAMPTIEEVCEFLAFPAIKIRTCDAWGRWNWLYFQDYNKLKHFNEVYLSIKDIEVESGWLDVWRWSAWSDETMVRFNYLGASLMADSIEITDREITATSSVELKDMFSKGMT